MKTLQDNHGRVLNYLRLAVTDRCNLRCLYCMPEEGLNFSKRSQLLSYEEMLRLINILGDMGISKVRITGGEPFVRKDLIPFMYEIRKIKNIDKLSITTNGTGPLSSIHDFKKMGIHSVNLSLDSLSKERFLRITRRDELDIVLSYYRALVESGVTTKINMVVMSDHNLDDIHEMCKLTMKDDVEVRFIEEMPFNGGSKGYVPIEWNASRIRQHIEENFGTLEDLNASKTSTSNLYKIKKSNGRIGIIPSYTRTICPGCDRIRLTPKGALKTCLYDNGVFSFRDFMREGVSDQQIADKFMYFFQRRFKDGFEAESAKNSGSTNFESMATIGG